MLIQPPPTSLAAGLETLRASLPSVPPAPPSANELLRSDFVQPPNAAIPGALRTLSAPTQALLTFVNDMNRALAAAPGYTAEEKVFFNGICGEASRGIVTAEVVADAWHRLQTPRFGAFLTGKERIALAEAKRYDGVDALLSPLGAKKATDTSLVSHLKKILSDEPHPELALSVYEFDIYGDIVREPTNRLLHILSIFLERIERALGNQVALVDVRTEEWEGDMGQQTFVRRLRGRILSPRFFQRALECLYPEKKPAFDYRHAEYDGLDLRAMRRRNVLGTSLEWSSPFLRDVQVDVPTWFYRLHDDYHNADQVLISPETKAALDRFSDLLSWIRAGFTGSADDAALLGILHDHLDDRESSYRHSPQEALERLWSLIPLYYLGLPVLESYWMRNRSRNAHVLPILLRRHYQTERSLEGLVSEFFPRSPAAAQAAYRKAVDYVLRKARLFPDADASAFLTPFFESVKAMIPA